MDLKTAIKVTNLVLDIEKIGDIKHQILGTLEDIGVLDLPSEESMEKVIEELSKAFDNILEELKEELRGY